MRKDSRPQRFFRRQLSMQLFSAHAGMTGATCRGVEQLLCWINNSTYFHHFQGGTEL